MVENHNNSYIFANNMIEQALQQYLTKQYPNKKPRKSYMAFSISPQDMDLTFLEECHLIERLVELNADNAKGTPVFIEP